MAQTNYQNKIITKFITCKNCNLNNLQTVLANSKPKPLQHGWTHLYLLHVGAFRYRTFTKSKYVSALFCNTSDSSNTQMILHKLLLSPIRYNKYINIKGIHSTLLLVDDKTLLCNGKAFILSDASAYPHTTRSPLSTACRSVIKVIKVFYKCNNCGCDQKGSTCNVSCYFW